MRGLVLGVITVAAGVLLLIAGCGGDKAGQDAETPAKPAGRTDPAAAKVAAAWRNRLRSGFLDLLILNLRFLDDTTAMTAGPGCASAAAVGRASVLY